jgi:hypothetical protein
MLCLLRGIWQIVRRQHGVRCPCRFNVVFGACMLLLMLFETEIRDAFQCVAAYDPRADPQQLVPIRAQVPANMRYKCLPFAHSNTTHGKPQRVQLVGHHGNLVMMFVHDVIR